MSSLSLLERGQEESSEEVTWEDQSRINEFSKYNKRLEDVDDELTEKKSEREQLDDLQMELELADEEEPVPYKLGDSFIYMPLERAQQQVESDMNTLDDSIQVLKGKAEEYERIMSELKVHLKNKFKDSINLDK